MLNMEKYLYNKWKEQQNKPVYTLCLIFSKILLHIEDNIQKWE